MEKAKSGAFGAAFLTEKTFEDTPEEIQCPVEVMHIWGWFYDLDSTRMTGMGSVCPITHQEITAWSEGMGIKVTPFERQALIRVDGAYRIHCSKKSKQKQPPKE